MYVDINTLFTFEVSKSDDQSILAAIVLFIYFQKCFCHFVQPLLLQ
jgi:hypothetical protein